MDTLLFHPYPTTNLSLILIHPHPHPQRKASCQGDGSDQGEGDIRWFPTGLTDIDISYYALHAFAEALKGMVVSGVIAAVPSPYLSDPTKKVMTLSLLYLCFACKVEVDGDLPPIWEDVDLGKGSMEGLSTLI